MRKRVMSIRDTIPYMIMDLQVKALEASDYEKAKEEREAAWKSAEEKAKETIKYLSIDGAVGTNAHAVNGLYAFKDGMVWTNVDDDNAHLFRCTPCALPARPSTRPSARLSGCPCSCLLVLV